MVFAFVVPAMVVGGMVVPGIVVPRIVVAGIVVAGIVVVGTVVEPRSGRPGTVVNMVVVPAALPREDRSGELSRCCQ